jgi:hypothetical protein
MSTIVTGFAAPLTTVQTPIIPSQPIVSGYEVRPLVINSPLGYKFTVGYQTMLNGKPVNRYIYPMYVK